jgi:hypothetical protein
MGDILMCLTFYEIIHIQFVNELITIMVFNDEFNYQFPKLIKCDK